jgi:hypothetical protein
MIPAERVFDLPISSDAWEIQGYAWAPKFSLLSDRALQKAGFSAQEFTSALTVESVGEGLTPEKEVLLVWAGQQAADRRITLEAVKRRRDAMGSEFWGVLVKIFAAVYGSWVTARATAQAKLYLSSLGREEERV